MIQRKYGWVGSRPYRPEPTFRLTAPTALDHVDRKTLSIPIRDQGDEGACTGFGTTRAIQAALNLPASLSPQFNYFNGRVIEATQDVDAGAMIGDVLDATDLYGCATESVYPYVAGSYAARPTLDAYADATDLKGRFKRERLVGSMQLRAALAQPNTLVVLGFSVFEYFESDAMAKSGLLQLPVADEQFLGGHCVCVDGFDSRKIDAPVPYLWVPNSWSGSWALGGWFKMPLAYVDDPRQLVSDIYAISPV